MKALSILDPDQPKPIRPMADALACDAPMVMWLVDRLEERGLVERRARLPSRREPRAGFLRWLLDRPGVHRGSEGLGRDRDARRCPSHQRRTRRVTWSCQ